MCQIKTEGDCSPSVVNRATPALLECRATFYLIGSLVTFSGLREKVIFSIPSLSVTSSTKNTGEIGNTVLKDFWLSLDEPSEVSSLDKL